MARPYDNNRSADGCGHRLQCGIWTEQQEKLGEEYCAGDSAGGRSGR